MRRSLVISTIFMAQMLWLFLVTSIYEKVANMQKHLHTWRTLRDLKHRSVTRAATPLLNA